MPSATGWRAEPSRRRYARRPYGPAAVPAARVNEVLREVLAEAIERMADSDERLAMLTVTAVQTDPDLRQARVLFDSLSDPALEALQDARPRLQASDRQPGPAEVDAAAVLRGRSGGAERATGGGHPQADTDVEDPTASPGG